MIFHAEESAEGMSFWSTPHTSEETPSPGHSRHPQGSSLALRPREVPRGGILSPYLPWLGASASRM